MPTDTPGEGQNTQPNQPADPQITPVQDNVPQSQGPVMPELEMHNRAESTPNVPPLGPPPPPQTTLDESPPTNPLQPVSPLGNLPPVPQTQAPPAQVSQSQPEPQGQAVKSGGARGGGFKRIILFLLALLLLGGIGLFAYRFFAGRTQMGKEAQLTWWGLWEDQNVVQPLIDEYQQSNPGVTITYQKQAKEDYRERLTNSLAKGEGPDIFRIHNTWVPMFKSELDNVPASFMGAAEYSQTYLPVVVSDMTAASGIVGVPLGYDGLTLYINDNLFAQEGVSAPRTWDDLREVAKRLTKTENGIIVQSGVALGRTENVDHWQEVLALMMIQNGADPNSPTNKSAHDALRFFTLFSTSDKVWDETLPNSTLFFANGNLAMLFAPSWEYFEIKAQNPDLAFHTVPLPQLPKQSGLEPDYSYANYWVEGVWARGGSNDVAWDFLKFLSTPENLQKLYKNASSSRGFGSVYPRVDLVELLADHPILGSIANLSQDAQSWYLASRTFDGPTGINTLINSYYEDAVNSVNNGVSVEDALQTAALGVSQVLTQFGIK